MIRVVVDAVIEPDPNEAEADGNAIAHLADRLRAEMEKIGPVTVARLDVVQEPNAESAEAGMLKGFRGS